MFSRILHVAALLLAIALWCSCSAPTAPSRSTYSPQTQAQPSPPTGGTTNIEGDYTLTITMSPGCSLPPEVRQRTYTARIRQPRAGYVTVELGGADFPLVDPSYYKAGFEGARNGDALHFVIANEYGAEYSFIERVDGTKNLLFEGVMDATVGNDGIAGWFGGEIRYFVPGQFSLGECTATDHRIAFTR